MINEISSNYIQIQNKINNKVIIKLIRDLTKMA